MVQRGKMDLIVMNQESASRTKAAARAWRAYEERTTKYFRVRMGRSGKEKVRTAAAKREQQGAERPLPSPPFVRSFDLFALRPVPTWTARKPPCARAGRLRGRRPAAWGALGRSVTAAALTFKLCLGACLPGARSSPFSNVLSPPATTLPPRRCGPRTLRSGPSTGTTGCGSRPPRSFTAGRCASSSPASTTPCSSVKRQSWGALAPSLAASAAAVAPTTPVAALDAAPALVSSDATLTRHSHPSLDVSLLARRLHQVCQAVLPRHPLALEGQAQPRPNECSPG